MQPETSPLPGWQIRTGNRGRQGRKGRDGTRDRPVIWQDGGTWGGMPLRFRLAPWRTHFRLIPCTGGP